MIEQNNIQFLIIVMLCTYTNILLAIFWIRNQADRLNKYQLYSNKNQTTVAFPYIYVSVKWIFVSFKNKTLVEIMLAYWTEYRKLLPKQLVWQYLLDQWSPFPLLHIGTSPIIDVSFSCLWIVFFTPMVVTWNSSEWILIKAGLNLKTHHVSNIFSWLRVNSKPWQSIHF